MIKLKLRPIKHNKEIKYMFSVGKNVLTWIICINYIGKYTHLSKQKHASRAPPAATVVFVAELGGGMVVMWPVYSFHVQSKSPLNR